MNESVTKLPRLLSVRAVSEATTIPRSTIYDLVAKGELPAVRVGENRGRGPAGLRLDEKDVAHWIERRKERAQ